MLFKSLSLSSLLIFQWIAVRSQSSIDGLQHNTRSVSSVLGSTLQLDVDRSQLYERVRWYKGTTDLKSLISTSTTLPSDDASTRSSSLLLRYRLVNRTDLRIEQTRLGDEGFYTLKAHTSSDHYKEYLYHVVLFSSNLSLTLSPEGHSNRTYRAEQLVNLTCSITFVADRLYMSHSYSSFQSMWSMILYNNAPDRYELLRTSSTSYTYQGYLINYELDRNDHNQTVSCVLIEQQSQPKTIISITRPEVFNVQFKAYLRGEYYFIRSFQSHSSIDINCEEFNGNPDPVYTLIWSLNGDNRTLLNQTKHGRYAIADATWRHRGNYTCLAENYLNRHQAVRQSFRLNIWFDEHHVTRSNPVRFVMARQLLSTTSNRGFILILVIVIFLLACLAVILSCYCFCFRFHQTSK